MSLCLSPFLPLEHWYDLLQPAWKICTDLWPRLAELLLCAIQLADHIFGYLLSFHAVAEGEWNSSRGLLHTDSLWQPWINTANAQNSSWTHVTPSSQPWFESEWWRKKKPACVCGEQRWVGHFQSLLPQTFWSWPACVAPEIPLARLTNWGGNHLRKWRGSPDGTLVLSVAAWVDNE